MTAHPPFDISTIGQIAKLLGEIGTGSDITRRLDGCGIQDDSGESSKWKQMNALFLKTQKSTHSSNHVLSFIKVYLPPTRFVAAPDVFENYRGRLNVILALCGLEYGKDGEFKPVAKAKTLGKAEARASQIRAMLRSREIHSEIYKYCTKELMQKNHFHAVFEAAKGLQQRIRDMSGLTTDGAKLIDEAFSIEKPYLVFNSLQTEIEKSEHKGLAQLLKGCISVIRNPLAHGPKILWQGENDTADYLTLISMLHKKLDKCVKVPELN